MGARSWGKGFRVAPVLHPTFSTDPERVQQPPPQPGKKFPTVSKRKGPPRQGRSLLKPSPARLIPSQREREKASESANSTSECDDDQRVRERERVAERELRRAPTSAAHEFPRQQSTRCTQSPASG